MDYNEDYVRACISMARALDFMEGVTIRSHGNADTQNICSISVIPETEFNQNPEIITGTLLGILRDEDIERTTNEWQLPNNVYVVRCEETYKSGRGYMDFGITREGIATLVNQKVDPENRLQRSRQDIERIHDELKRQIN